MDRSSKRSFWRLATWSRSRISRSGSTTRTRRCTWDAAREWPAARRSHWRSRSRTIAHASSRHRVCRPRERRPPSASRCRPPAAARVPDAPSPAPARLTQTTEAIPSSLLRDAGEVVLRERALQPGSSAASPPDLSVFGLAGSRWGRKVLLQGLALGLLVLVLTSAPLIAWGQMNGASILSSWPVLLPVVVAAAGAGVAVASLIARTTARGLSSQGK